MPRVRRPTSRLAQLLRLMRTGHPRRREAARLRRGLRLEALEKRELLTTILVNVRDDVPDGDIADGTVSLRDAVDRAPRGAIIAFAPHLDGATIALESFGKLRWGQAWFSVLRPSIRSKAATVFR